MIINQYYLTTKNSVTKLQESTDLSLDEIEKIVGRFRDNHYRFAGLLKGEVVEYIDGEIIIRHHFKKRKILWKKGE